MASSIPAPAISAAKATTARWTMRAWTLALLALGLLGLLGLFHTEAMAAVRVWNDSTAFGHCYLVLPIAAWLAWERRDALSGLVPRPIPALALLAVPMACVWFIADRLGLMEGRQFVVLGLVWLLAFALLGFRIGWVMVVPLIYLVFLVPFGDVFVPVLQQVTARFIDVGLEILQIPHVVTETLIEIPEGNFFVAEACAGLRFLIAAIAFGVLYACVMYRSTGQRIAFIALCMGVPVLANGMRALGIVVVGHIKGSAEAGAVDHVLYGWIFFSFVILLLLLLGLPFRQALSFAPRPPTPAVLRQPRESAAAAAGAAVLLFAACGPVVTTWLDQRAQRDTASLAAETERLAARLMTPPACAMPVLTQEPGVRHFDCGDQVLEARVRLFSPHAGPAVLAAWRDATVWASSDDSETTWSNSPAGQWLLMSTTDPNRGAAVALWLDGAPVRPALRLRMQLAFAALGSVDAGSPAPVVFVAVTATGADSRHALAGFVAAQRDSPLLR